MIFERTKIDSSLEKRIVAGMIVSKKFMDRIYPVLNMEYFENPQLGRLAMWSSDFYTSYQDVPGQHIKDLVATHKKKLDDEDYLIMCKIIDDILSLYSIGDFNDQYLTDQAIRFFKKRELEIVSNNIKYFLGKDDVNKAEHEIDEFKKVTRPITDENGFVYSDEALNSTFDTFKDGDDYFFRLPKALGKFLGNMNRGWLVGISAPFKKGKCIYENDRVLMDDGSWKTIKNIVKNKLKNIVVYNEFTGKFQSGIISDHYNNGKKEVFEVTTRTGRIVHVTHNHPFLTDEGWRDLDQIKIGTPIAVPKIIPFFGDKNIPDFKVKVLAYLLADGGLTLCTPIFSKKEMIVKNDFIESVKMFGDSVHKKQGCDMSVVGCNVSKWLKKIHVKNVKSKQKTIPGIVFKLKKQKIALFLQTLFTCDGSIYKMNKRGNNWVIEYSSASKKLTYQISHLLLRFGIYGIIRHKKVEFNEKLFDSWILELKNKENILKFCKEIGFRPGKKYDLSMEFMNIFQNIPNNRNLIDLFYNSNLIWDEYVKAGGTGRLKDTIKTASKHNGGITRYNIENMYKKTGSEFFKFHMESDVLWDKIVSIKSMGKKQTYDLTVTEHHNFVANDVIVHNTFLLSEIATIAALSGLRVVFFSLEMSINEMRMRVYKRMTGTSDDFGEIVFPCFDCKSNQDNSCQKPERINHMKCPGGFSPASKYRACSICKDSPEEKEDYIMAYWSEIINVPKFDYASVSHKVKLLKKEGKANIWMRSKPRFSASVEDLENDLDNLEHINGFIPDLIIVDYADILQADDKNLSGVQKEDEVWMCLARMASKRHALVITATQLNKDSLNAKQIGSQHTAKWIGKLGHVDAMFALNQTPDEKAMGLMRVSILEHRHKHFVETQNCYVIQKYSIGCFHLDSYFE